MIQRDFKGSMFTRETGARRRACENQTSDIRLQTSERLVSSQSSETLYKLRDRFGGHPPTDV